MAGVEEQVSEQVATNGQAPERPDFAVENPATGEIIAHVPNLSPADVAEMAVRGRQAQPGWNALGFDGRARVLMRAQKWLIDNKQRVIDTIMSETGKTYEDAMLAEISYGAGAFGFWAKNAEKYLADERVRSSNMLVKGKKLVVRYKPLGLIGVIGPWNYPLTNSFGDCIPAMAAGNSVILKPSEITPLTSLLMAECMRDCGLPEHVYQVATGLGDTGAALVDEVDMIMFTGSTATGKKVAAKAAESLTPLAGARRQGPDDRAVGRRRRGARPTPPSTPPCRTPARPASPSSACSWRSRCTTGSSARCRRRSPRCARACPAGPARSRSAR